jgi:hypothetical protein
MRAETPPDHLSVTHFLDMKGDVRLKYLLKRHITRWSTSE